MPQGALTSNKRVAASLNSQAAGGGGGGGRGARAWLLVHNLKQKQAPDPHSYDVDETGNGRIKEHQI